LCNEFLEITKYFVINVVSLCGWVGARMAKYIVSACLVGLKTRYDGTEALCERIRELVEKGEAVPFCPEQAGGLPTPRTPAEITGGDGYAVLDNADFSNPALNGDVELSVKSTLPATHIDTGQTTCIDQGGCPVGGKADSSGESKYSSIDSVSGQTNQAQHAGRTGSARVVTRDGVDVTANYIQGAKEMLKLARMVGAAKAVMKAKSPSCGAGSIYNGTFSGNITRGDGVAVALLKLSGIDVMTEDDFANALKDD
jgi:uncharacterized protein YbbK (DUF523 family)